MIRPDYESLLIALSFCSAGLALTFFVNWLVSRADKVLLTWTVGTTFLVASVSIYSYFVEKFLPTTGVESFAAMQVGLIFFLGAAEQFRTGKLPIYKMIAVASLGIVATAIPMLNGYNGISFILFNIAAMLILFATAWEYWRCRSEAPALIATLSGLYSITGVSFFLCAAVLTQQRSWTLDQAPQNWAEILNMTVSLTAIAAIGALSLALSQVRVARRHKRDAETDALTGLFNRRALFERARGLQGSAAIVVFDIDHFKQVNDAHGHQMGDVVLQRFGKILESSTREGDMAARLGGEEFAILLPYASLKIAMIVAERVRQIFSEQNFSAQFENFNCSVSVGVAHTKNRAKLPTLMRQADAALYTAKRSGRNRVVIFRNDQDAGRNVDAIAEMQATTAFIDGNVREPGASPGQRSKRKGRLMSRA
jgi:diguanylate cyclase (GGDEF)-like protein